MGDATSSSVTRDASIVAGLTRGLRLRYVSALVAVATLAILHQAFVQPALVRLNLYAPVINVAGRQRMLSQRLTKASLAIRADRRDAERFAELEQTLETWSRSHDGLRYGSRELDLPATTSPHIVAAFEELQPHFEAMLDAGRRILSRRDAPDDEAVAADVQTILHHESRYLPVMDRIVGLYEHEARDQVAGLQLAGFSIVGAILVLLGLVGWFVVLPANTLIGEQLSKLAASETRYRSLVERMTDGLAVFRLGGCLEYANDRLCEMLGQTREELVGRPLTTFAAPADRPGLIEFLERADRVGSTGVTEVDWQVPGRDPLCTMLALGRTPRQPGVEAGPSRDEAGVEGFPGGADATVEQVYFAVVTDISDRKRAENVLREARDELEERVAERTAQLVETNSHLEREIAERLTAEERSRTLQHQLAHAGRVTAIGELATGLAHELNQPLGAIVNYVETIELLLQRPSPDLDQATRAIEAARSSALRAGSIIRRMRRFVQGRRQEQVEVDPNELVAEVVELCTPEARRADVRIETRFDEVPAVRVDALGIQQVVVNLVQNAIQAMLRSPRDRRSIRVETAVDGDRVSVRFVDSGPGFDSDPEEFFEPFRSTRDEGLGMGLPISRSIVREHGGELFSLPSRDGGAIVGFTLPAVVSSSLEGERVRA